MRVCPSCETAIFPGRAWLVWDPSDFNSCPSCGVRLQLTLTWVEPIIAIVILVPAVVVICLMPLHRLAGILALSIGLLLEFFVKANQKLVVATTKTHLKSISAKFAASLFLLILLALVLAFFPELLFPANGWDLG